MMEENNTNYFLLLLFSSISFIFLNFLIQYNFKKFALIGGMGSSESGSQFKKILFHRLLYNTGSFPVKLIDHSAKDMKEFCSWLLLDMS